MTKSRYPMVQNSNITCPEGPHVWPFVDMSSKDLFNECVLSAGPNNYLFTSQIMRLTHMSSAVSHSPPGVTHRTYRSTESKIPTSHSTVKSCLEGKEICVLGRARLCNNKLASLVNRCHLTEKKKKTRDESCTQNTQPSLHNRCATGSPSTLQVVFHETI